MLQILSAKINPRDDPSPAICGRVCYAGIAVRRTMHTGKT